jgi:hypothetical protein
MKSTVCTLSSQNLYPTSITRNDLGTIVIFIVWLSYGWKFTIGSFLKIQIIITGLKNFVFSKRWFWMNGAWDDKTDSKEKHMTNYLWSYYPRNSINDMLSFQHYFPLPHEEDTLWKHTWSGLIYSLGPIKLNWRDWQTGSFLRRLFCSGAHPLAIWKSKKYCKSSMGGLSDEGKTHKIIFQPGISRFFHHVVCNTRTS